MTSFLVSSAGRRGALVQILQGIARTSGGTVTAIDASPLSAAGHLADHFEIVPRVDTDEFVDAVLDTCTRYEVDVVIPTIDPEVPVYARNRMRFIEKGIDVWAPSAETARLGFDKWEFFTWLAEQGIPTVETFQANDSRWQEIAGPVVAKPRSGSSSIGVTFHRSADRFPTSLPADYIVQGVAPGVEVTVDFAVKNGHFLGAVPRLRLETRSGEVSKGITVHDAEVERVTERMAKRLPGMYGVGNVQMFFDAKSGSVNVIELNPRFGGGYPLSHAAGADLVSAMLETSPHEQHQPVSWEAGVTMLRYDDSVFLRGQAGEST